MGFTVQQKRAIFWVAGIIAVLVLVNVAWAQLAASLTQCLSP